MGGPCRGHTHSTLKSRPGFLGVRLLAPFFPAAFARGLALRSARWRRTVRWVLLPGCVCHRVLPATSAARGLMSALFSFPAARVRGVWDHGLHHGFWVGKVSRAFGPQWSRRHHTGDAGSEGDAHVSCLSCALASYGFFRIIGAGQTNLPTPPLKKSCVDFQTTSLTPKTISEVAPVPSAFMSVCLSCHHEVSARQLLCFLPVFMGRGFPLGDWWLSVCRPPTISILSSRINYLHI